MSKYNEAMDKIEVSAEMKSRILQNLAKELSEEAAAPSESADASNSEKVLNKDDAVDELVAKKTVAQVEEKTLAPENDSIDRVENKSKVIQENEESEWEQASRKRKNLIAFRRYGALAATFAVLFLGVTALMRAQGGKLSSTAPSYSAEMAVDSAVMSEAPAYEEAATEAAVMSEAPAEAPVMSEAPAEAPEMSEATQEAAKVTAGAAYEKAAGTTQDAAYATESAAEVEEATDSDADETAEAAPISGPGAARVLVLLLGSILMLALFAGAIVGIIFLIRFIVQKVKKRYKP
ncbi:hypothetical protein [Butyrivibrio sp. AE2032]|uniref:hypothetical protein n=1 Tax=Butyrivibrio sp. AE2032 TaxID=1458463 RepID=UPI0005549FC5|nr:hypothetical protein [Butyrivibrio sp. AE2032]